MTPPPRTPVGGSVAALATKSFSVAKYANKALQKVGVGGRGVGIGKYRIALHAPHNVTKRYAKRAPVHAGRWHWHTGPNRVARRIVRVWKRI